MELLLYLFDFIRHIDVKLVEIVAQYGTLTYFILFAIIFCETGLVVTPFLPGDSLLFAAGAVTASSGAMNIHSLLLLLIAAAIIGDATNYLIGKFFGNYLMTNFPRLIKPQYIDKTNAFFEKYGGKTIILARFVPIVRTFAPFMAGVGGMHFKKFTSFNVFGAIAWVTMFGYLGYIFGDTTLVKKNFSLVILMIIIISLIPPVIEFLKARKEAKAL